MSTGNMGAGESGYGADDENPYDLLAEDHDEGAWVREAAMAHEAKHAGKDAA